MSVTPIFRNAGALCAEHHGGNCPDPAECIYRDDSAPLNFDAIPEPYDPAAHNRRVVEIWQSKVDDAMETGMIYGALLALAVVVVFGLAAWEMFA